MLSQPCASCSMRCCTHFTIPVSVFDIGRICAKLKCPATEFCRLVPAESIEQAPHANVFLFGEDGAMRVMALVLKKKPDNSCTFFRGMQGCSIHGFHPMACRAYPFVFGGEGGLKKNRHFVCPRDWKKNEYDAKGVANVLDGMEREIEAHDKIIRKWNAKLAKKEKGNRVEKAFFAFLQSEINVGL